MTLKKGVVMDSLPVNDTINETYSLFLPMSFQSNGREKAVIFVLDTEGRGKAAAQLFKPAAEEQGYIIASSNNIDPDNSFEENVMVAARLMNAVTSNIPLDYDQISIAGFAEGARVASSLPAVFNNLHGVIAVGDHQVNYEYLDAKNRFVFVGMAGDEDFSGYGLRATAMQLESLKHPVAVYSFDGGHGWPKPEILSMGVSSLTLQAMKEGKRPKDQQLIENLYRRETGIANKLISTGDNMHAYNLMDVLQEKYDGLRNTSEIKTRQKQLSRSRNFSEEQREFSRVQEKEARLMEDFIYYLNEDVATENFENLGWWNYQKRQLDELASGANEQEADMAKRILGMLKELSKNKITELASLDEATLESKLLANMIQTIFDQENFKAYKDIISLSAQDRDYSTSLFYLEEMLKNGFDDMEALYDLEGTLALKMTPEYNWLVRKYLGSSKYYDVPVE
ncbi:hypothetical protein GCM10007103_07250 [Salinimicrobium marinum]|uniref:Uncharacterized protein n=2 Tax=Salinimicrobium marinum TaxID=680283 RepID=A0A918S8F2_9FLAO|nr:hypothetical protein GCM10007103_07250 [Salinimicrobium marinum]